MTWMADTGITADNDTLGNRRSTPVYRTVILEAEGQNVAVQ
jgi:hypothetical protein